MQLATESAPLNISSLHAFDKLIRPSLRRNTTKTNDHYLISSIVMITDEVTGSRSPSLSYIRPISLKSYIRQPDVGFPRQHSISCNHPIQKIEAATPKPKYHLN